MLTRTFDPKAETRITGRLEYWVSQFFFTLKLGFEIRNNTKVPPGDSEHTDTITSSEHRL